MCLTMSSVEFMSFVRRGFDENEPTRKKYADVDKEHIHLHAFHVTLKSCRIGSLHFFILHL